MHPIRTAVCLFFLACVACQGVDASEAELLVQQLAALPTREYVGGMDRKAQAIAGELRQAFAAGRELPDCEAPAPGAGLIIATGVGRPPAAAAIPTDPVLVGLQALLAHADPVVRERARYAIGELGPAARELVPSLEGDEIERTAWSSHALSRLSCEQFAMPSAPPMEQSLSLPIAARQQAGLDARLALAARCLAVPGLAWPDRFFQSWFDDTENASVAPSPASRDSIRALGGVVADATRPASLREDVIWVLLALREGAAPAVPSLLPVTRDPGAKLSALAAGVVLGGGGTQGLEAARFLLGPHEAAIVAWEEELCALGQHADAALIALVAARLQDEYWSDAEAAAELLGCYAGPAARDALLGALTHPSWHVQLAAVKALAPYVGAGGRPRAALESMSVQHWSGLIRQAAEQALRPPAPSTSMPSRDSVDPGDDPEEGELVRIDFSCFHRCTTDHLNPPCSEDGQILDGRYLSPSLGRLDVEWQHARRHPRPADFPLQLAEDGRPDYGSNTFMQVDGGWLFATDRWHYDGEVGFVASDGIAHSLSAWGDDGIALLDTPHFGKVVLGQSLFGVGRAGLLSTLRRERGKWRLRPRLTLPSPPWAWSFAPDGTLLVADPHNVVAVMRDGRLEALACPKLPPRLTPPRLLALATMAESAPLPRRVREARIDAQVTLALVEAARQRYAKAVADPRSLEPHETPERLRDELRDDVSELIKALLVADDPSDALAQAEAAPFGRTKLDGLAQVQLFAALDRNVEALQVLADGKDGELLKFRALVEVGQGRRDAARRSLAALAQRAAKEDRHDPGLQASDPYVALLLQLAGPPRPDASADAGATAESHATAAAQAWPSPLLAYARGEIDERELGKQVFRRNGRVDRERLTEALYFKGAQLALAGRRQRAARHFRAVLQLQARHFWEYHAARLACGKACAVSRRAVSWQAEAHRGG